MQSGVGSGGGGGHHQVAAGQGGAPASGTGGTGDDEAPKDPGARITHQSYTEKDFEGKPAFSNYEFIIMFCLNLVCRAEHHYLQ